MVCSSDLREAMLPGSGARLICVLAAALGACGDVSSGPSTDSDGTAGATFTIGGTVTGLAPTTGAGALVLQNGAETLRLNANGPFLFTTKVPKDGSYDVRISAQPTNPTQTCTVSGGSGTVTSDVTSIAVHCSVETFSVGGRVTGLGGSGLKLRIDDREDVDVTDGTYVFPTPLARGSSYSVVVKANPTNRWQTCTVSNGVGVIGDANVTNADVVCVDDKFSISGTITGLMDDGLVLTNTYGGGEPESVRPAMEATSFAFTEAVRSGESYAVTLATVPASLRCTITNGSGTIAGANITDVAVACEKRILDFELTGAEQVYTVPAWATSIEVTLEGAQGGTSSPTSINYGGMLTATLAVTPNEQLSLFVGGQPSDASGGFNGGGAGDTDGRGGGGATDIRRGGNGLAHRILVAGGGGGGGTWASMPVFGGQGGGPEGQAGNRSGSEIGGLGGTQTGSGTGVCRSFDNPSVAGGFGFGGTTVGNDCGCDGYGGGGGYWGGAASGNCRGGGGGSGFAAAIADISNVVHTVGGARPGNGHIHFVVK